MVFTGKKRTIRRRFESLRLLRDVPFASRAFVFSLDSLFFFPSRLPHSLLTRAVRHSAAGLACVLPKVCCRLT
jgi:hypothetical protein